ncbi:MAG: ATP-binding protein [Nanobdellota archaeon]
MEELSKNMDEKNYVRAAPTKEFFIEILTRDIELIRVIPDLIDNSIDGALRVNQPLEKSQVRINFTEREFVIEDNCGGIPRNIGQNYAFRFGRATKDNLIDFSIGQFGVGMKRALFKLGKKVYIETMTNSDHYKIEMDVNKWKMDSVPHSFMAWRLKTALMKVCRM